MAVIEVLSGDFRSATTRIRYSDAGRAYLGLTSTDDRAEAIFLETDVASVAEAGEGRIGDLLHRLAARDGLDLDSPHRPGTSLFVVLLADGRKLVARAPAAVIDQFRVATLPPERRRAELARLVAARAPTSAPAGFLPRLVPGLFALFQPHR